ncbi:MAG: hypothetical protein V1874_11115 [Spirochaetota bacterium]
MQKRKKSLINKKFQLKTSLKLALASLIPLFLIMGLVVFLKYDSEDKLLNGLDKLNEAVKTEDNIIQAYLEIARVYKDQNIRLAAETVKTDHEKSIEVIQDYLKRIETQVLYLQYFFIIISVLVVLHAVFFFRHLIRYTHRISGPVFLMGRIIKAMLENTTIEIRNLRKKDEFKDVYEDLIKLYKKKISGQA